MLVAQCSLRSPFAARIHIHIDVDVDSVVFFKPRTSLNKSAWRVLEQGSKIAIVRSYLRVTQVAGQVIILIFLVKIKFFPIYANRFCDAGQVPIFRYFKACRGF